MDTTEAILDFVRGIGLGVREGELPHNTFLPGIALEPGGLVIDRGRMLYPGDLLHEAGHLAVMEPARRNGTADVGTDLGDEIAAQCWSYAAAVHLQLAPEVVFHAAGYKGSADSLIEVYRGGHAGVPLLAWMGLCLTPAQAAEQGTLPYPAMVRWLREADVAS